MTDNININQIVSLYKDELLGYKHITSDKLRTNINIKYYNPETKELSKKASITRIQYYSEITKNKPMILHLQAGTITKSWNIICKKYIIFRQFNQESQSERTLIRILNDEINKYNENNDIS